jgi:hypothetical protein
MERLGLESVNLGSRVAAWTLNAIRPAHISDQRFTSFFGRKVPLQLRERNVGLRGERLASFNFRIHEREYSESIHDCQA